MKLKAFIDSHLHVLGIGYYQDIINLNNVTSIEEIVNLISEDSRDIIVCRGYNQENLREKRSPEKKDLSRFLKPVVIFRVCGHVAVVNQAMMNMMKLNDEYFQVAGGSIDYEKGILSENALKLIQSALPKPTKNDIKRYLINANKVLIENGITKVASDDFSGFDLDYEKIIEAINEVDEEGLLDVEITEQVNLPKDKLIDFINKGYVNKRYKHYKLGPLKILADGSLGGRTASLNEPYSDELNNSGILTFNDNELLELIELASSNDMDSVVHAIGDRAADLVINAIIKAQVKYPRKAAKNAIIHAQILNRNQIALMSKHNIKAIVQPIFINSDIKIIESRVGERSKESYLFKTMYDNIHTGFSTDSPVENVNPFHNLYCAITRKSINFPNYPAFNVDECFSLSEAINAYTNKNLDFVYSEESNDYIEINKNIFEVGSSEIKDLFVKRVIIDGKIVFDKK